MADGFLSSASVVPVLCFVLSLIEGLQAGEFCWTGDYVEYCEYDCCGSYEPKCCDLNVALIVGCVVGGILCVAVIVTVVCCILKKQGYRGRVVGPHPVTTATAPSGNNVTVVHANQPMGYATAPPPPHMNYPQPGYYGPTGSQGVPPPPYVYSNPTYPPAPYPGNEPKPYAPGGFAAPAAPGYSPSTAAP